jgi:HEAT repeats
VARVRFVQIHALGRLGLLAGLIAGAPGCTTTWDDVTSRNFHVRSIWESSDPMTVLHDSKDGDERAKAIRVLKEPRVNGGNDVEQERVIQVLTQAAVSDPQPVCRLAAVQTLGRFSDPRNVQILTAAYEAATQLPSEVSGAIQSAALMALGNTKQQMAIAFLVRAATKPTPAEAVDREINQARDVRLSAVRALKNYEGSAEVAAAMVQIMRAERDVAMQDRAHETYVKVTGHEPPADAQVAPNAPVPLPGRSDDVKLAGGSQ